MEYQKCLVEVDEVLRFWSIKDLKKIPLEIRKGIKIHKDKTYIWKYDMSKKFEEQNLDRNTVAILDFLNMEYLANNEQKDFLKKLHLENDIESENEKKKKYNADDMFKNRTTPYSTSQELSIVEEKNEKFFEKVFKFFKKIFKRYHNE